MTPREELVYLAGRLKVAAAADIQYPPRLRADIERAADILKVISETGWRNDGNDFRTGG